MFCGLNGSTRKPRFVKSLHKPATSSDLPALEAVPCIIKAQAGNSLTSHIIKNFKSAFQINMLPHNDFEKPQRWALGTT